MTKNKKLLLLVTLLLAIKMVILPQLATQNENLATKEQLLRTNKKLSLMLSTVDEEKAKVKGLVNQLIKMQELVPTYISDSQAKLAIQQQIEQYAEEVDLVIQRQNWQAINEDENLAGIMHGKVLITVKGSLINILRFQNLIADNQPAIVINSMYNAMPFKKMQTLVTSRVVLDVLFQQGQK
ncbi:hypothetical protein [Litorilituus lipolyticus]|uniref:Uncharacterized protein n=1 Tax=Litorilituus lipolyticus TaxID=2491017 RepID=A0A502L7Q3_9GAMM|nr:hypothetical protein [Litorilituus lipolyticus]TPH18969.1 hypothetical protein EPA86_01345 [Litorilituus lipolyticus]